MSIKKVLTIIFLMLSGHTHAMELVEQEVNLGPTMPKVVEIMTLLYKTTKTSQVPTDYVTSNYIFTELQQDPKSYANFIIKNKPSKELLARFFDHRQNAITKLPDDLHNKLVSDSRSSIVCALSSSVVACLIMIYYLWECHS